MSTELWATETEARREMTRRAFECELPGAPEEFAAMACFLCSDLAGFTTGTAINMDGGASPVV